MIDKREWDRLVHEATQPLTPAEQEERLHNTHETQWWGKLKDLVDAVMRARQDFCKDALLQQVAKGEVPEWILEPQRGAEARGWLKEHGYHWQIDAANPLWMGLKKGERLVAELKVNLKGDETAQ